MASIWDRAARRTGTVAWLAVPLLLLHTLFFLGPLVFFGRQALYESAGRAQVDYAQPTLDNLSVLFTDAYYRSVLTNTLNFGLGVVALCLLLGFPLSYMIARSRRVGRTLLIVVLVTSFTGTVVRALGWQVILGGRGVVNSFLMNVGIVDEPLTLINNMTGAVVATTHAVLPYMILLLTPVLESIHPTIEEAAVGMGAGGWRVLRTIVLPLSIPGLIGGSILVFTTTVGSFTTPAMLGGPQIPLLPVAIRQQTTSTLDYPLAAAMAIILTVSTLVLVYATTVISRRLVDA